MRVIFTVPAYELEKMLHDDVVDLNFIVHTREDKQIILDIIPTSKTGESSTNAGVTVVGQPSI